MTTREKNLQTIYGKLYTYHLKHPYLRTMQFLVNFVEWHQHHYGSDGFYIEDDTFLERLEDFMREIDRTQEVN